MNNFNIKSLFYKAPATGFVYTGTRQRHHLLSVSVSIDYFMVYVVWHQKPIKILKKMEENSMKLELVNFPGRATSKVWKHFGFEKKENL